MTVWPHITVGLTHNTITVNEAIMTDHCLPQQQSPTQHTVSVATVMATRVFRVRMKTSSI